MKETSNSVDRGWAWVVLAACTLEAFFLVGYLKSFGLYFVEFLNRYETDAASLSLVIMIQTLVASATALVVLNVGPLCITNRTFMIVGTIFISGAIMMNGFAPNLGVLTISNGVLFGIGVGCTHAPAMVMVSFYFDKRRGLANCVTNLGASLGGFVIPIFIRYLLDYYGLSGSLIILSGIMLNIVVFSALMRPINLEGNLEGKNLGEEETSTTNMNNKNSTCSCQSVEQNITETEKDTFNEKKYSFVNLKENTNIKRTFKQNTFPTKETITYKSLDTPYKQKLFLSYQQLNPKKSNRRRTTSNVYERVPEYCKDKAYQFSNILETLSTSSIGLYTYVHHNVDPTLDTKCSHNIGCEELDSISIDKQCCELRGITCKQILRRLINVNLILNRRFLLLFIVSILSIIGCAIPVTFIPPHAKDLGIIDRDIALLLTIIGGSDLAGRLLTIFVADKKFLRCYQIVAISIFITGIALNLAPVLTEFWSLAVLSIIYGVFAGVYLTLFPVVLVDFVGLENFSSGMGLLAISHGCALALAVPCIGLLRNKTGSYLEPLHLMGTCLLVGAGLLMLDPFARKCQEQRINKQCYGVQQP